VTCLEPGVLTLRFGFGTMVYCSGGWLSLWPAERLEVGMELAFDIPTINQHGAAIAPMN